MTMRRREEHKPEEVAAKVRDADVARRTRPAALEFASGGVALPPRRVAGRHPRALWRRT